LLADALITRVSIFKKSAAPRAEWWGGRMLELGLYVIGSALRRAGGGTPGLRSAPKTLYETNIGSANDNHKSIWLLLPRALAFNENGKKGSYLDYSKTE